MTATAATVQPATARAAAAESPRRADRVLVAAGACATVVGAQVLASLVLLSLVLRRPPAVLYEAWIAAAVAAAVGWVLLSGGTMRVRTAVAWLGRPHVEMRVALLVATVTTCALVPLLVRFLGGSARTTAVTAVAAASGQVLWVAGHRRWTRRRRDDPAPPPRSPRTLANAVVATFLAASALTSAGALPDVFPISRYPMFSAVRLDPHVQTRVRFVGVDERGATTELRAPASRNLLARMARDDDVERLTSIAAALRERSGAARVRVVIEELQVATYPATPQVVVVSATQRVTVDGR